MDDWLNTDVVASSKRIFRPFEEARFYARSLGLKGYEAWKAYCKSGNKPKDIPFSPDKTYPSDFNGWGNWLGTGTIANFNRVYRSFAEARAFVHTLGLQNGEEWSAYCKSGNKPDDIPASPEQVYKADYVSAGDWLGTGRIANYYRIYRPFVEARAFTRTLGLRNGDEWKAYCKSGNKPVDIPANPHGSYGTLFTSMGDWLDTENIASSKYIFRPFA